MPSSESLDRSIHNAIDGHGNEHLSKDDIITKLKKANAALTDRTAEMEVSFMNQCNKLALEITEQTAKLNVKNEEITSINSNLLNVKEQLMQKDEVITSLEEEKVFQKSTITDLKNQLFQLQTDVEDVEFDKSEEIASHDKKSAAAEGRIAALEKENTSLKVKVDKATKEKDECKQQLDKVQEELEESNIDSIEIEFPQDRSMEKRLNSTSGDSVTSEVRQNWKQLEGVQEKLQTSEAMLHETQSSLATLERKYKASLKQVQQFERHVQSAKDDAGKNTKELRSQLDAKESSEQDIMNKLQTSEAKLQESMSTLDSLEKNYQHALKQVEDLELQMHGGKSTSGKHISELKSMLKSRDDTILNLHERLETFNEDLTKAEEEIDNLTSQLDTEELGVMQADLDDANELLEKERDLTASLTEKYQTLSETVEKLQDVTKELREGSVEQVIADKDECISSLEQELAIFRAALAKSKESSEILMNLKARRIVELEEEVKEMVKQTNNSESTQLLKKQVKDLTGEKAQLKTQFEKQLAVMESQIGITRKKIEAELMKNSSMEESHKEEIKELKSCLVEEANEARQDMESLGEDWKTEKKSLQEKIKILEAEVSALATMNRKLKEAHRDIEEIQNSEHASEIANLREELTRAKEDSESAENARADKQSTAKRAYAFSIEKKYKKDVSDLDAKRRKEVEKLQSKLADRDTTITAMVKSSVSLEQEISVLKETVNTLEDESPPTKNSNTSYVNDHKVSELRNTIADLLATKSTMTKQIARLKKQLSDSKSKGGSSPVGDFTKQLNDYKIKLQERDGAIATLVRSSITQEQQISVLREEVSEARGRNNGNPSVLKNGSGPSWQEFSRLQQESEMFAGQIIELDEEVEDLRQQLADEKSNLQQELADERANLKQELADKRTNVNHGSNLAYAVEELGNQVQEQKQKIKAYESKVDSLKTELEEEHQVRKELEKDVRSWKTKLKKNSKLERVENELEEVEAINGKLQHEVRELRRKMRTAQLEAEKVPDLEAEMTVMRDGLNKMKLASVQRQTSEIMDMKTQGDLQHSLEHRAMIEANLKTTQEQVVKLEDELMLSEDKEQAFSNEVRELKLSYDDMERTLRDVLKSERDRCTKLSDSKETSELKFRRTVETLTDKIKDLENDIDEQNEIISALTNEVKKLRSSNFHDSDSNDIILALTDEVKKLRNKQMSDQGGESDVIQALSQEVKNLHAVLKKREDEVEARDIEATVRAEVEDELISMKQQKEFLSAEVTKLQAALTSVDNDNARIKELKKKVDEAEKARTLFEKTMISTYERKLNLMQMNKDLTIDGLRKELSQCKERHKILEADLLSKIRSLEKGKREIEAELQAKMQHKNAKIQFLEQTLSAHEHVSGHMKEELDQLQSGMETVSVTRRAEVEDIQEELMDAQAKATKYAREITSLKMKVEETRLQHRNEVDRLHNTLMSLENDSVTPMMRDVAMERERRVENDHRQQLKDLMTKVNLLQEENVNLKHNSDKDAKVRASNNDKWRNSALQEQVMRLQQKLREYEGDSESVRSGSSRRSAKNESSRRIPRTPTRSFHKDSSNSRSGGRDDISTHTEMTF